MKKKRKLTPIFELCVKGWSGKLSSKYRFQTALRTDERVRFMDEIISAAQVIKMYAWEKPFAKLIDNVRKMELKVITKISYIRAFFMTFQLFTTRMALFCTMLSIVLIDGSQEITAAKIYVVTSYFNIISYSMGIMFILGVGEIAESFVAFKRLQTYLQLDEKETNHLDGVKNKTHHGNRNGNGFNVSEQCR